MTPATLAEFDRAARRALRGHRVLVDISDERRRQKEKWGSRALENDMPQTKYRALSILMEECGELAQALLEHDLDAAELEAVQVAAVAAAIVEGLREHKDPTS